MSEENKALARRWLEILNQGNLDVANEIYAPDYVDHDPTMPEDVRGVEGAREFYSIYRSAFPDAEVTIEEQVAEGDMVATIVLRRMASSSRKTVPSKEATQ